MGGREAQRAQAPRRWLSSITRPIDRIAIDPCIKKKKKKKMAICRNKSDRKANHNGQIGRYVELSQWQTP